jgi:hypothetical protein
VQKELREQTNEILSFLRERKSHREMSQVKGSQGRSAKPMTPADRVAGYRKQNHQNPDGLHGHLTPGQRRRLNSKTRAYIRDNGDGAH